MRGRKRLYHTDAERPVALCVRVPRSLYERLQREMDIRRLTLTEAIRDALQLAYSTDVCHPVHGKVATQST